MIIKKIIISTIIFLVLFLSLKTITYAETPELFNDYIPITSIDFEKEEYDIGLSDIYQLEAITYPEGRQNDLEWSSENPEIVSSWGNGEIYANSVGSTYIIARASNEVEKRVKINVIKPILDVVITGENHLLVNEEIKLNAKISPEDTTEDKTLIWSSNDENILTVDQNGVVKGISPGIAEIKVETNSGVYSTTTIEVLDKYRELEYIVNNVTTNFADGDKPIFTGETGNNNYIIFNEMWYILNENGDYIINSNNPTVNDMFREDNRLFTEFELGKTYKYSLTIFIDRNNTDYIPKYYEKIILIVNGNKSICNCTDMDRTTVDGIKYWYFQCDDVLSITIPSNIAEENKTSSINEKKEEITIEKTDKKLEEASNILVEDKHIINSSIDKIPNTRVDIATTTNNKVHSINPILIFILISTIVLYKKKVDC